MAGNEEEQRPPKQVRETLEALPAEPGVYLMRGDGGDVLYIGKALSLRSRVRSYFQPSAALPERTAAMVEKVRAIDFVVTRSELDALLMESDLIKQHKPPYNVKLRDQVFYPYIKITTNEEYPRVMVTRVLEKDGARYFGPYASAQAVREALKGLRRIFPLRSCKRVVRELGPDEKRSPDDARKPADQLAWLPSGGKAVKRTCLNYDLGLCAGVCAGLVTRDEYNDIVKGAISFLGGNVDKVKRQLQERMDDESAKLNYEAAAALRDQVRAVDSLAHKQQINILLGGDEDYIGLAARGNRAVVSVLFMREGKPAGHEHFTLSGTEGVEPGEVLGSFAFQHYSGVAELPRGVYAPVELEAAGHLAQWLSDRRGSKVEVACPQRGKRRKLVEMATANAEIRLSEMLSRRDRQQQLGRQGIEQLKALLALPQTPVRIEAFDISNIGGSEAVGSMVSFTDGVPDKSRYKRFKIRSVAGIDDYAMMREVLTRRYKRVDSEGWEPPDLVLIDGGKGHLSTGRAALDEMGLSDVPAVGLAKRLEEVFVPGRGEAVVMPVASPALHVLQYIRDEAHRFAITYHRRLRSKRMEVSRLDEIPGIGAKRKLALLTHLGSVEVIADATEEELLRVPGMTKPAAAAVRRFFQEKLEGGRKDGKAEGDTVDE